MQIDTRAKENAVADRRKSNKVGIQIRTQNVQVASKPEYVRALQTTIELTHNKKVNAKNAFSVDLDCLNNIQEFMKAQNVDKKWIKTGEAIGAGAQVYGFRVDNVHTETYRMLSGITRNVRSGE